MNRGGFDYAVNTLDIFKCAYSTISVRSRFCISNTLSINIAWNAEEEDNTILFLNASSYILITYAFSHFLKQSVHGKAVMCIQLKNLNLSKTNCTKLI